MPSVLPVRPWEIPLLERICFLELQLQNVFVVVPRNAVVCDTFWFIMLKRVLVIGFMAICAFTSVGVLVCQQVPANPPERGISEQESGHTGQKHPQAENTDHTPQQSAASTPQPPTVGCDESCQQGRESLKIQNRLAWLTGGLVLVGLLQIGSMCWQACLMSQTRIDVHAQTDWMRTQTNWLIEKERPRLSIELDIFDPRPTITGDYCVTGTVFIYGHAVAKVRKTVICVSTDPRVVENAFEPFEPSSLYIPSPPQWIPDEIELPRVIHPNSYGIRFTATVYGTCPSPKFNPRVKWAALNR